MDGARTIAWHTTRTHLNCLAVTCRAILRASQVKAAGVPGVFMMWLRSARLVAQDVSQLLVEAGHTADREVHNSIDAAFRCILYSLQHCSALYGEDSANAGPRERGNMREVRHANGRLCIHYA